MKTRRTAIVGAIIGLVAASLSAVTLAQQAGADVPITQVARLKDQQPVSGTYDVGYTNYGERVCANPRGCSMTYYRVGRGTLKTKLNSYVIKEGMKKYDFYLLTVETALTGQSGSSKVGAATVRVRTTKGKIIDTDDSKSVKKEPESCTDYPVTVGAGWGVASGGIEVGAITLCDETASVRMAHSGADAVYTADRLPKIRHLTLSRIVKVKAGSRPTFMATITYPTDACTKVGDKDTSLEGKCVRFQDHTSTVSYAVGTGG